MKSIKVILAICFSVLMGGCASYKIVFDHEEARGNYKGCCMVNTKFGPIASVYNNDSRHNSELMVNWATVYKGSQETIGQGVEFNNKVYFPAENGKGIVFDGTTARGTVSLRHSSAVIIYKGTPCFVSSEDSGEYVINAESGEKILKLNVGAKVGIPFAAAQLPSSDEWIIALADNNGNEQLVTTDGKTISLPNVTSVANWNGTIIAGAAGVLYKVDVNKSSVKKYKSTGSEIVNNLWVDGTKLWVSCSGTDKLLYYDSFGISHKVGELKDDEGSALFDTRVTKDWWYRAIGSRAQWYRVE